MGKTVLGCLLTRRLVERECSVAVYKPLCSGGREDAEALLSAQGEELDLDAVNPWHFRAPLAPLLAARRAGRSVTLAEVVRGAKVLLLTNRLLVMEGAGGLLSPLGEGFDALDLIRALHASPVIVCPNRLGAVNQARLVWTALSEAARRRAQVVLAPPAQPDASTESNVALLAEYLGKERLHRLPWSGEWRGNDVPLERDLAHRLDLLLAALGLPRGQRV